MDQLEFNDEDLERILSEPDLTIELAARNNIIIEDILNNTHFIDNNDSKKFGDLISQLPNEIIKYIFSKLDTNTLLIVSLVSIQFNTISNDFEIWKQKCKFNEIDYDDQLEKVINYNLNFENYGNSNNIFTKRQIRLYSIEIKPFHLDYKAWKRLYFELGSIEFNNSFDLIESAIESSTFDDQQVIEHTLEFNKKFWSSKGNSDINSSEYLIYKLDQPICLISSVQIHVFKAVFQAGLPVYSPQAIRISVGFTENEFHYRSDLFPVKQVDEPQTFSLEPHLVVGGYIRLDLIGRHQTQSLDGLYYTVLRYVCADGIPIGSLESSPELSYSLIKYYSNFVKEIPKLDNNNNSNTNDINEKIKISYDSMIQQLRSMIAPKLDKKRIYNSMVQSIIKDLHQGRYESAIESVFEKGLRSPKIFNLFTTCPNEEALSRYFCTLLQRQESLSMEESLLFTKESIESGNINLFTKLFLSDRIYASDQLGEYLLQVGLPIVAAEVFNRSLIPDKVILCLFISGSHMETVHLISTIGANHQLGFSYLIDMFRKYSNYQAYLFALTAIHNLSDFFNINTDLLENTFQLKANSSIDDQVQEITSRLNQEIDYLPPLQSSKFTTPKSSKLSTFFEYFKKSI